MAAQIERQTGRAVVLSCDMYVDVAAVGPGMVVVGRRETQIVCSSDTVRHARAVCVEVRLVGRVLVGGSAVSREYCLVALVTDRAVAAAATAAVAATADDDVLLVVMVTGETRMLMEPGLVVLERGLLLVMLKVLLVAVGGERRRRWRHRRRRLQTRRRRVVEVRVLRLREVRRQVRGCAELVEGEISGERARRRLATEAAEVTLVVALQHVRALDRVRRVAGAPWLTVGEQTRHDTLEAVAATKGVHGARLAHEGGGVVGFEGRRRVGVTGSRVGADV